MLSWFLNPWMLLGGLAIASPILIHLLNKRRFKIVEWAAMDFLFQADKKNRRRVELENFILLALRCLAMILLAFMLARPFLPSSIISLVQQAQKYERIIMIDDSLSLRVLNQNAPAIETIKTSVNELLGKLASEKTENWLTVILTSRPDQPLLANEPLTQNTLPTLTQTINSIDTADKVADYSVALSELNRIVLGKQENMGRVVYLYSDMRERDWMENKENVESAPNELMNKIAEETLGCFLIDVGNPDDQNLAVVSVRPDGLLLTNKSIRFNVAVSNFGSRAAQDVKLLFQIDEGQPRYETLESIAPGQTQEVTFLHQFKSEKEDRKGEFEDESKSLDSLTQFHRIRAEIDRQSLGEAGLILDQLQEDSSSLFAAKVSDGISVLLVDGDPSAARERSETHYLKSLQVPGTGLKMTTVTVSEFETIPLGTFQVIFLCNVDEASADRVKVLRQWVSDGGGLVFMPGNRVRAANFNSSFYGDGSLLSPFSLNSISGSPAMNQWVNFDVSPQSHPSLQVVIDSDASSLSSVDIFSWWSVGIAAEEIGKTISVPLRLTDENNSPAMAERTIGDGKVVAFAFPGDGDWSMWPSSPTYVPIVIDLIDYLVGSENSGSNLAIGGSIQLPVDLALFLNRVSLRDPKNEKIEAIARPIRGIKKKRDKATPKSETEKTTEVNAAETNGAETLNSQADSETESQPDGTIDSDVSQGVEFNDIQRRGFYSVERKRHSGPLDSSLFAVNYDARESKLTRLAASTLDSNFFSDKVTRLNPNQLADKTVAGGNSEVWPQILLVLFGILITEQFLAWWWGRKR